MLATPAVKATGAVAWPSMLNVTWPVGVSGVVPPTVGATVALKVTPCPKTDGLGVEPTVAVVPAVTVIVAVAVRESAAASALAGAGTEAVGGRGAVPLPS